MGFVQDHAPVQAIAQFPIDQESELCLQGTPLAMAITAPIDSLVPTVSTDMVLTVAIDSEHRSEVLTN